MLKSLKKILTGLVIFTFVGTITFTAFGQVNGEPQLPGVNMQKPQPPMENVFFNVLWGSATGGMLMMGWGTIDDSKTTEERYRFQYLTTMFITGATYGGVLGLIAGVYFSVKGIRFDESRLKLAVLTPPSPDLYKAYSYQARSEPLAGKIQLLHLNYSF